MLVVLISGKQGSGKSTLADNLVSNLKEKGYSVHRTRFAKVLYEMHDAAIAVAKKYDIQAGPKEGEMLQWLGTEWGRNLKGQNVWVDALKKDLNLAQAAGAEIAVIDDCRFENELDFLDNDDTHSAMKVRLEADKEIRKARCSYWRENDTHISETGLDHRLISFEFVYRTDKIDADSLLKSVLREAENKLKPIV